MYNTNTYLLEEYDQLLPDYQELLEIVQEILNEVIADHGFKPMQVGGRVKTRESLSEKILRKEGKYHDLRDITDIAGIRILFYYSDQVDAFADVIKDTFSIDPINSIDKRQSIPPTTFGYISLHFICRLSQEGPYPEKLKDLPFEIQLRTVLQHNWAEIEHDLGYKAETSIPRKIRREFAKLAGLLEIADERFVAIRRQIEIYSQETKENISGDCADDMTLDLVTLEEFLRTSPVMTNLVKEIAAFSNATIHHVSAEGYLERLRKLDILTIGDLKEACSRERGAILERAGRLLEGSDIPELVSTVGLYYLCRVLEA